MAQRKRYTFVINGRAVIGKTTGQAKARGILTDAVNRVVAKGWTVDTKKADHAVVVSPTGKVKSVSLVS